jgi:hypothetical protein
MTAPKDGTKRWIIINNKNSTLACVWVTEIIRYILPQKGILVLNYIDDIFGIAPDKLDDNHVTVTIGLLNTMGFNISNSKTVPLLMELPV